MISSTYPSPKIAREEGCMRFSNSFKRRTPFANIAQTSCCPSWSPSTQCFAASIAFQHSLEQLLPSSNAIRLPTPAHLNHPLHSTHLAASVRMITLLCPERQFHSPNLPPSVDLPQALLWSRSSCAPASRAAPCRNPGSRCTRIQFDHGAAMSCVDERNQTSKQESISTSSYFRSQVGADCSAP